MYVYERKHIYYNVCTYKYNRYGGVPIAEFDPSATLRSRGPRSLCKARVKARLLILKSQGGSW